QIELVPIAVRAEDLVHDRQYSWMKRQLVRRPRLEQQRAETRGVPAVEIAAAARCRGEPGLELGTQPIDFRVGDQALEDHITAGAQQVQLGNRGMGRLRREASHAALSASGKRDNG